MKKGLLRLNDEELDWLEGRLALIDIQKGCPVQCIVCGVDAPKHSGCMPWSDYMILSNSIQDVKDKKSIDLLGDFFDSFWSSDPIYYRSFDGGVEKNISDIILDITSRHNKDTHITTAGWKYGNNYMQTAAEKLIELYGFKNSKCNFTYSIKTVSKSVMREYDYFLDNSEHNIISNLDFITKSSYVSNLVNNAYTFKELTSVYDSFEFQFIHKHEMALLDTKYDRYKSLFSRKFMETLHDYLYSKGLVGIGFDSREFLGMGKALTIGNLPIDYDLKRNMHLLKSNKIMFSNDYNAQINCHGTLQIYCGEYDDLSKVLIPKEYFTILADNSYDKDEKIKYEMLANLQGKELLK